MCDFNPNIISGQICPYCNLPTSLEDSKIIYGQSYGPVWYCFACGAYVGCHEGTEKAKGRLANERLRSARREAHRHFDFLWKFAIDYQGRKKREARTKAYDWLALKLGIDRENTHIGYFDEALCKKVVSVCLPVYQDLWLKINTGRVKKPEPAG